VAILCLLGTVEGAAQVGGDSLTRTTDSLAAPASKQTRDIPPADTTTPPAPVSTPSPAQATAAADTTLKRVCTSAAPGMLAPGLLAVVFRPGTTKPEAIEAARAVGGAIAGMSDAGEVYVEVPPAAGPLAVVADQLIRQNPVTRVSPTPCPAPPPASPPPGAGGAPPAPRSDTGTVKSPDSTVKSPDSSAVPPVRPGP
jgi:hypothetical protein